MVVYSNGGNENNVLDGLESICNVGKSHVSEMSGMKTHLKSMTL